MSQDTGFMFTASGRFWPFDPSPEHLRVIDIAVGLSNANRFAGQTRPGYSVAQHAVLVANHLINTSGDLYAAFVGLHHDDEEAYLGDMTAVLKHHPSMQPFLELGERVRSVIFQWLGITDIPEEVHAADRLLNRAVPSFDR